MKQWFAVRTHRKREMQATTVLTHLGIESYFPQIAAWKRPKQQRVPQEALFPGYVFARVDIAGNQWVMARSAPGVAYFLGAANAPVSIPEELIDAIKDRAEAQSRERRQPRFMPGDHVRIESGPFHGLEAVFDGTLNGTGRVRVLLTLLNRLTSVDLAVEYLRPAA